MSTGVPLVERHYSHWDYLFLQKRGRSGGLGLVLRLNTSLRLGREPRFFFFNLKSLNNFQPVKFPRKVSPNWYKRGNDRLKSRIMGYYPPIELHCGDLQLVLTPYIWDTTLVFGSSNFPVRRSKPVPSTLRPSPHSVTVLTPYHCSLPPLRCLSLPTDPHPSTDVQGSQRLGDTDPMTETTTLPVDTKYGPLELRVTPTRISVWAVQQVLSPQCITV